MIIPIPNIIDEEQGAVLLDHASQADWVFRFLNCESWTCACGLTNFGRNKKCADQKCNQPRPNDYVEPRI